MRLARVSCSVSESFTPYFPALLLSLRRRMEREHSGRDEEGRIDQADPQWSGLERLAPLFEPPGGGDVPGRLCGPSGFPRRPGALLAMSAAGKLSPRWQGHHL